MYKSTQLLQMNAIFKARICKLKNKQTYMDIVQADIKGWKVTALVETKFGVALSILQFLP